MIININQEDTITLGISQSSEMGIDLSNPDKIFYLLSQGFYKNPKKAIVQELTSNMIDAYVEAEIDILENPAQIILSEKFLQFIDFGIGISPDRMDNIMSKFFASTKDKRDDMIGAFGLGFKSIFSYTNQFTITSVFEGVKREWIFSKDVGSIKISLILEEDTTEISGTSFVFRIKDDYGEVRSWYNTITETITYFKGVYFTCNIGEWWNQADVFNKKPIIEGDTFYYRNLATNNLQICLDQVIYMVDQQDLNLPYVSFPFALKFTMNDGLIPTPSRESLIMSNATKDLIKMRFRECLKELDKYCTNKKVSLYEYYLNNSNVIFRISNIDIEVHKNINITCHKLGLPNFIELNSNLSKLNLNDASIKMFFLSHVTISHYISHGKITYERQSCHLKEIKKGIVFQNRLTPPIANFLRETANDCYILKLREPVSLRTQGFRKGYIENLGLNNYPRNEWRQIITAWQEEIQKYISLAKTFDHEEYKEWLSQKPRATAIKYKKQNNEIIVGDLVLKEKGAGYKVVKKPITLSESGWFIYDIENSSKLERLKKYDYPCYIVSPKDVQLLEKSGRKFISLKDFHSSKGYQRHIDNGYMHDKLPKQHDFLFPDLYASLYDKIGRKIDYFSDPASEWTKKIVEKVKKIKTYNLSTWQYKTAKSIISMEHKIKRLELEIKKLKK